MIELIEIRPLYTNHRQRRKRCEFPHCSERACSRVEYERDGEVTVENLCPFHTEHIEDMARMNRGASQGGPVFPQTDQQRTGVSLAREG